MVSRKERKGRRDLNHEIHEKVLACRTCRTCRMIGTIINILKGGWNARKPENSVPGGDGCEHRIIYPFKAICEQAISDIGRVLELDKKSAKFAGEIPSGKVLIDGSGVGDIGNVVLRDRKHLSEDGLVVVVASIDTRDGYLISGPDIVSRGFVYVKESSDLMQRTKETAERAIDKVLRVNCDSMEIKNSIRDDVAKFIFKETKRRPMILPVIMDIY